MSPPAPILCSSIEVNDDSALTLPNVTGPALGPSYGDHEERRPVRSSPGLSVGSPWLSPLGAGGREPPVACGFLRLQTRFPIRSRAACGDEEGAHRERSAQVPLRHQLGRRLMAAHLSAEAESAERGWLPGGHGAVPMAAWCPGHTGLPLL